MRELSRYERWYGRDEPPVERREVRAGPLTALVEGADLRYVRFGGVEVIRRLFVAVRDRNWRTPAPVLSRLELASRDSGFALHVEARCVDPAVGVAISWRSELAADGEGALECSFEGVAEADFLYNRIGFCILHPAEIAGRRYRARTPEGEVEGTLERAIGPQLIVDGLPAALFPAFDRLELEVADGLWARFELEGDLFEMEDQRNWTDASFKTYSTPLSLGFPHQARAGQRIAQRIRLTVAGDAPPVEQAGGPVRVRLGAPSGPLPAIGLGSASHGRALSGSEAALIEALRPDHLRVEVDLAGPGWGDALTRGVADAAAVGAALELAVFLPPDGGEAALDDLARRLGEAGPRIARVLVFRRDEPVTPASTVRAARERLAGAVGGAPFVGGSDILFTDVNRRHPELEPLDGIAWPLNATVHADDDTSVVETMAMHGEVVRSACGFCGDLPLYVTPVTFNMRFNPHATGPEPELEPGALPPQVDPRQPSLLGAGWTLGSAKSLAEAGVAGITYFETSGWRGVIEEADGCPVPERFCSWPGMVFPLYHVLADLGEWKGGQVVEARSSDPLAVEALAVWTDEAVHVLVANVTASVQRCEVAALPGGSVSLRVLDESSFAQACAEPASFRAGAEPVLAPGGTLALELAPYAIARVDAAR